LVSLRSKKTEKQIADLKFEHSDEMEGLCVSFANRTLDAIIFVALTRFPKILGEGTKYGKIKTRLQEAFRELEFKLASGKLR
jgi:hypothetical protein